MQNTSLSRSTDFRRQKTITSKRHWLCMGEVSVHLNEPRRRPVCRRAPVISKCMGFAAYFAQCVCTCSASVSHPGMWFKACFFHVSAPVSALHWRGPHRPKQREPCLHNEMLEIITLVISCCLHFVSAIKIVLKKFFSHFSHRSMVFIMLPDIWIKFLDLEKLASPAPASVLHGQYGIGNFLRVPPSTTQLH